MQHIELKIVTPSLSEIENRAQFEAARRELDKQLERLNDKYMLDHHFSELSKLNENWVMKPDKYLMIEINLERALDKRIAKRDLNDDLLDMVTDADQRVHSISEACKDLVATCKRMKAAVWLSHGDDDGFGAERASMSLNLTDLSALQILLSRVNTSELQGFVAAAVILSDATSALRSYLELSLGAQRLAEAFCMHEPELVRVVSKHAGSTPTFYAWQAAMVVKEKCDPASFESLVDELDYEVDEWRKEQAHRAMLRAYEDLRLGFDQKPDKYEVDETEGNA